VINTNEAGRITQMRVFNDLEREERKCGKKLQNNLDIESEKDMFTDQLFYNLKHRVE
jgi:hypothetical protein